uniref:Protein kinase domain-containing protein n=1 Tax=Physcomitrium patens TaxID=3218 RepID=A0A2K1JVX4_PHYPA|nr:hypothetical protein PHYPA_015442 [Physcomitrium patens]
MFYFPYKFYSNCYREIIINIKKVNTSLIIFLLNNESLEILFLQKIDVMVQIDNAICYLYDMKVAYCDLKPHYVIVVNFKMNKSKMHTVGKHGCNPRNDEANTTTVPGSIACNLAGWTTTSSPTQVKAACAIATATCTQILRDHQVSSSVEQRFSIVHLMQFSSQGALHRHRTVIDYDPTECLFNHTYRLGTVNYT